MTAADRALLDRKAAQYTKARCVMNYDRETFTQPGLSGKEIMNVLQVQAVKSFERGKLVGQQYEIGKGDTSFWLLSSSKLLGEVFMYADSDSKSTTLHTCTAKF